ncbi:hypothetical protein [Pandoraea sputorum]|uniref:Uncharacterized protein n=1 Tax=Pandoraea sputorum TaxID=93222 RepID=A0A5E5BK82_9BURK|nr:hypothetical protein [Pandoraea sputorum]VVE84953.1 hypothetical protein PSP31121_05011 [Pandoraea sputorum]
MNTAARRALALSLIAIALAYMVWREVTSWHACRAAHATTYCLTTWEN